MPTLSVIIPTYNEADYLEDALFSVNFADEVIVIDSCSTDHTKAIAMAANCIVLERTFDNFSAQKNAAIAKATGDWILFMDADERVSKKLKHEILTELAAPKHNAYLLKFPHFYMNRFLYHHIGKVKRLAKNDDLYFEGAVHEKLITKGSVGKLKNYMIHYTYKGLTHYLKKKDSYAWFQAETRLNKGKKVGFMQLAFKPAYRFFHSYIIKRGFIDGIPGLAVAAINAYGVFSRYVKQLLLEQNKN